jgi:hypothetical protein
MSHKVEFQYLLNNGVANYRDPQGLNQHSTPGAGVTSLEDFDEYWNIEIAPSDETVLKRLSSAVV